jgi:hypothetical protein
LIDKSLKETTSTCDDNNSLDFFLDSILPPIKRTVSL